MGEDYRSFSSSLCGFLRCPVTSSLLGPNILLSTLFSNTHSLRSSLNVSDQVIHHCIVCLKRVGIRTSSSSPITVLTSVLPHLTVESIYKPEHLRTRVVYFRLIFFNKATLRRSLAEFSYSRYTICKLVKPSTIRTPTHLSILITSLRFLKINTYKRRRTSTSTCTSKQKFLIFWRFFDRAS